MAHLADCSQSKVSHYHGLWGERVGDPVRSRALTHGLGCWDQEAVECRRVGAGGRSTWPHGGETTGRKTRPAGREKEVEPVQRVLGLGRDGLAAGPSLRAVADDLRAAREAEGGGRKRSWPWPGGCWGSCSPCCGPESVTGPQREEGVVRTTRNQRGRIHRAPREEACRALTGGQLPLF
jgi:hypothetical protein